MSKKQVGMMAGADPTAPGGMSMEALRTELVEKHGWAPEEALEYMDLKTWPALIDTVISERRARELEQAEEVCEESHTDSGEFDYDSRLLIPIEGTKDYIFNGHKGAGPSAAERWTTCTASLGASRSFLETLTASQQQKFAIANEAARQGTTAHKAAETEARVLLGEITTEEADTILLELSIMPETEGEAYDDEMGEWISEYTDVIRDWVDAGETVLIEEPVSATIPLMTVDADGNEEVYVITGSADAIKMPRPESPVLDVGDLKYGQGKNVDPDSNPQVRIYGIGAIERVAEQYGEIPEWLTTVRYLIAQPRLGGLKFWEESVDDLLAWRDEFLSVKLTEALGGIKAGAAFVPSEEACQWCPARGSCPALVEHRMGEATELFEAILDEEVSGNELHLDTALLSNEDLGRYFAQIRGLIKLHDEMKEEVQRRLYRGMEIPGSQLVCYTPPRKWSDEAEDMIMNDDQYKRVRKPLLKPPTLVTPTQALKILGDAAAVIEDLIESPDKRPVVAPVGDRRKPWTDRAPDAMFDIIEEDDDA